MPHNPALPATIPLWTLRLITGPARCKHPGIVPQDGATPRLIERDPMLHLGTQGIEDHTRIVRKVRHELLLVEHAPVPLVQRIGQVPVEQRDQGRDPRGVQVVHEFEVEVQALLIDGVIASAQGDDTGPDNGSHYLNNSPIQEGEEIKRTRRVRSGTPSHRIS